MLYGNMMLRARNRAAKTIEEEPERFFLPENAGIVDQAKYNEIIGKPADYKPKLDPDESLWSVLSRTISGGK